MLVELFFLRELFLLRNVICCIISFVRNLKYTSRCFQINEYTHRYFQVDDYCLYIFFACNLSV